MTIAGFLNDWWAYVALVVAGFLPNEMWRWLGIVVARGLDENSELVQWVRAVAVAVLAGVIAKLTLFPPGVLAEAPLAVRLSAVAIGFAVFLAMRRSLLAGVLSGQGVLIAGMLAFG
jgi:hypothetical protein